MKRLDLRGNIKSVGSAFFTVLRGRQQSGRALVQRTIVVERGAPWRRGHGRGVLLTPKTFVAVGKWKPALPPGVNPWDLDEHGDVREDIADSVEIRRWLDDFYAAKR